jgi:hypothetical protein
MDPERSEPTGGILTDEQRALLTAALNCLVPPNGDLPGAGDLGVTDFIERVAADSAAGRRRLLDGLTAIRLTSLRRAGAEFAALDADGQESLLAEIEAAMPEFFGALVSYAYRGYYTDPRVQAAVGFESRPPHPRGHEQPVFDAALLERQRQRAPFWRPTS